MQKLKQRRKTNTPTNASQVRGNCDLQLNRDESLSVSSSKTCFNNPEVNQSQHTARLKTIVYVISIEGKPLMPCTPAKAKKLLKRKRAKVVKLFPFTIKLNFVCENQIQEVSLGIDSGYGNVGFSAVTKKKEVMSGTLILDDRTSIRLTERAMYRRKRRNKLWYRKSRFLNRGNQKQGWLPPSTQRRYNAHLKLINLAKSILPISKVTIETANFDIQKLENPEIRGTDYQQGEMYGETNLRSYLLSREKGKCQICQKEFTRGNRPHIHHKDERKNGGSDRVKNASIIHEKCHKKLHKKGIKLSAPKSFKAGTFMSTIQNRFQKDIPYSKITFGYLTFVERIKLGLEKSHCNDAFVISIGENQERCEPIAITQKHRNNRAIQISRKGFAPSIRKQRYSIQPKDLIWIDNKKHVTSGTHCNGTRVIVEATKKSHNIKKVQQVYNFGSFAFNQ